MIENINSYFDLFWKKGKNNFDELLWFIGGQIFVLVLNFISIKILARLGTEDYGIYSLIITISFLIGAVYYGPAQQGFLRFYSVYVERGHENLFLRLMIRFVRGSTLLLLVISAVGCLVLITAGTKLNVWFFIVAALFLVFLKSSEFFNVSFNILRRRKENSIAQSIEKFFIVVLLLVLIITKSLSLLYVLAGLASINLLFTFIKYFYFKRITAYSRDIQSSEITEIVKSIWIYALPFIAWGISGWLQLNGEKWIIAEILSTSDVGIYAIMISLVSIMIGIPNNLLNEFFNPIIYQQFSEIENKEKIKLGLNYINILTILIVLLTLAATVISFFGGNTLILLISYQEYTVYSKLLPLLTFGTGIFLVAQTMSILGLALNRPKIYMTPKILIGVISIVLNYFLIKNIGIEGVAYAVLVTGIIYFIHIYFINRKLLSELRK